MCRKCFIFIALFFIITSAPRIYACFVKPCAELGLSAYFDQSLTKYYMKAGDTIGLYGLYSYDDDGGDPNLGNTHYIKSFHFIFGDGTSHYEAYPYPGFDGNTEHTYNSPMLYTVKLDVYDNDAAEGGPPDKNDVDICQLAVVWVNLNMEGVPDDSSEVNPGGYVPVNDDDDNDNGIEDKDEAPVNGEDNLVGISLSILPANLNTGEVELRITTQLRVWKYPDKRELIIPDGDKYYKRWSPQELPPTLYVEGIGTVLPQAEWLQLSYIVDGSECIHSVLVNVTVIGVWLYRDGGILDDWPKTANEIRSPKYIFGKTDPIYVKVNSLNRTPLQETFYDYVKVTSECGGVRYLNMYYGGEHWFNNYAQPGELLYLADDNFNDLDGDHIKVIDEEVLKFWLEIQPGSDSYRSCKTVMVDRGEFATGTGRSYDSKLQPPNGEDRTPLWNAAANEFKNDITNSWEGNLDWWNVGEIRGAEGGNNDDFANLVKNAGENLPNHLEADMFYAQSHGRENGDLRGTEPIPNDPAHEQWETIINPETDFAAGDWNNDLDWPIIKACRVIYHIGPARPKWRALLEHGPRKAHGMLSFDWDSASDYADYVDDFMDEIGARHTIITSWINANTAWGLWSNQPYGIVYHTENADDRFQKPSEGVSLTRDVTTSNFSYAWRDSGGQTGTDGLSGDVEETRKEMEIVWRGLKKTQEVRVGRAPNGLQKIRISAHHFETTELSPQFTLAKKYESGIFKMSNDLNLNAENLSKEQAVGIASEFIKQLPLPEDAVMLEPEPLRMSNFEQDAIAMAYAISFTHPYRGCVLAGDHITLVVQSDGVKLVSASWHNVTPVQRRQQIASFTNEDLKSTFEALRNFYPVIQDVPDIQYVRPVYYVFDESNEPRIVWEVNFKADKRVFWDPVAKQAPNYFTDIRKRRK